MKEVSFRPPLYQSHRLTAVAFPLQCLYPDSYRFQILRVGEGKQEACIHQHGTGEYFIADAVHGLRIKTSEAYMEVLRVSMGQPANRYQHRILPVLAYRKAAEAQMDLHNFHDYSVQETHSENVGVMADRLKTIRDCPLVCTEAMIHTNGSGVIRSLSEFAKLHINFYTWGLHACDANWEVSWGRSTFYAWEPIFHNILFANGDAVDQRELDCIRTFRFVEPGESIDPGVENSERWTERRAWKWMNQEPIKGLRCESYDEAKAAISRHSGDRLYNCINVRLKYSDYTAGASSFKSKLTQLLKEADAAGMTVIPTLADESNLNSSIASTARYIEDVINSFYQDRRIKGGNVV